MSATQVSSLNAWVFIPKPSEIFEDHRTCLQKIVDQIFSWLREINYSCLYLSQIIADHFKPKFDLPTSEKSWKKESKGLYVLIHGLNSHPSLWQKHIQLLNDHTEKDLFVPYVPFKGNCTLECAAEPLLNVIKNYIKQHPTKPICLIGTSNGGRICTWLETKLRFFSPTTPIKVSTIAAVHFGTSRMNIVKTLHKITGLTLGFHPSIISDLSFGSKKAQEILKEVLRPAPLGIIRQFEFFASTEDTQVPELGSSIPKLGNQFKAIHHVVHGYNHGGIVFGVAHKQLQSCHDWMEMINSS